MFGYMSKTEALEHGFQYHGSYFGIPVWIGDPAGEMLVATKWAPMEYVMTAFHYVEGFMRSVLLPSDEPVFQFKILAPIQSNK